MIAARFAETEYTIEEIFWEIMKIKTIEPERVAEVASSIIQTTDRRPMIGNSARHRGEVHSPTVPFHERDTVRIKLPQRSRKNQDMKIRSTIAENKVIINVIAGKVILGEIASYLMKNLRAAIGKRIIWDFSEADFSDVSVDEMRTFSVRMLPLSEMKRGEKEAFVSANDLPFGMMRIFQTMTELDHSRITYRSFRTVNEAKNWLMEEKKP